MVLGEHVVVVEADKMDSIEFGMEDIEGNMDHPIEEVGVGMDEMEELHIEEDKDMDMD